MNSHDSAQWTGPQETVANGGGVAAMSWVSAVPALEFDQIRGRVNRMSPEDKQRAAEAAIRVELGSDACALAEDYRVMGNLDRAAHWFTIAAHYRAPGARRQLDDLNALREALTVADSQATRAADLDRALTPSVEQNTRVSCQEPVVPPVSVQDRTSGLDVVDEANRRAKQIVADARRQAEQIVADAHHRAESITTQGPTPSDHQLLYVALTDLPATWSERASRTRTLQKPHEFDFVWTAFSEHLSVAVECKSACGSGEGMPSGSARARRLAARTQLLNYLEPCGWRGVENAFPDWVCRSNCVGWHVSGRAVHQALADLRDVAGSDVAALVAEMLDGAPADRLVRQLVDEELRHRIRGWLARAPLQVAAPVVRAFARVETDGYLRSDQERESAIQIPGSSHRSRGGLFLPQLVA